MYPGSGKEWKFNVLLSHEQNKLKPGSGTPSGWKNHVAASAELLWRHYFEVHKNFKLGAMVNGIVTFENLYQNYTATLIHAPAFAPTPSTKNYFNVEFRSNNYGAIGISPVWTPMSRAQLRGDSLPTARYATSLPVRATWQNIRVVKQASVYRGGGGRI